MQKIERKDFSKYSLLERLELAHPIPKEVYIHGNTDVLHQDLKYITIVGSRKMTGYGYHALHSILSKLSAYPICIISGLALGTDTCAHECALTYNIPTISIPGSGLSDEALYPRSNLKLSREIVLSGGLLLSEYSENTKSAIYTFPARNRLMAALSDFVLIVEAEEKSGSMITARLGMDYHGRVGAIPGPIDSAYSAGTNYLIKQGAALIRSADDILEELGFDTLKLVSDSIDTQGLTPIEQKIYELLISPKEKDELLSLTEDISEILTALTMLEIKGLIIEKLGTYRRCA